MKTQHRLYLAHLPKEEQLELLENAKRLRVNKKQERPQKNNSSDNQLKSQEQKEFNPSSKSKMEKSLSKNTEEENLPRPQSLA